MTIRQILRRRSDQYASWAFAFLLAAGIAAGYAPRILAIRIVFALLVGVVLAAAFWSLFEIPCPNCGKRLGSVGFRVSVGRASGKPEHCPHCGIGVDEELPNRSKAGAER
jgi:predicted RNA-binding Zn-ribbon protein involved in translation (DUF1610 family)